MQTILLAGVSSKIGQALANLLLTQGHRLILVNRDTLAFEKAVKRLERDHSERVSGQINCDFSDLTSIDRLTRTLTEDYPRIDSVFYNVGIINQQKKIIQPQGVEEQFMVNAIAPWYLLRKLGERQSGPLTVTCSGSAASRMVKHLSIEELIQQENYNGFKTAYAPSKAALKVLMHQVQITHPDWNVSVVDLWPTKTDMVYNEALPWLMRQLSFAFMSPERSALRLINASGNIDVHRNLLEQETPLTEKISHLLEVFTNKYTDIQRS